MLEVLLPAETAHAFCAWKSNLEDSPEAVVATAEDGTILFWSSGAESLFGYGRGEAVGRFIEDLIVPPDLALEQREYRARALEKGTAAYESVRRRKDGSPVFVSISSRERAATGDTPRFVLSSKSDITHLQVARDAKLVESHFSELLESMPDGIVIVNRAGRIVYCNRQTEALFGYSPRELKGEPIESLLPHRFRAAHVTHRSGYFNQSRTRAMGAGLELYGLRKDGTEFPVEISLSPLRTEEGTLAVSAIRDTSERRRIERALQERNLELEKAKQVTYADKLRESDLRFRQLAENIHEVFYLVTADFSQILYVSPGYETIWGRPCEELYADPHAWLDAIHPEDRARVQVRAEGYDLRYRIRRPDSELRWIHDRAFPIPDDSGVVYRVAGIAEDVTVAVQMEKQLKERGDRLRHAQELARLAHVVTDSYGGFVSWSETLPAMIATVDGAMPRSTRMWVEMVHPDDRELFRNTAIEAARTGVPTHVEYRLRRRDGVLIHLRQAIEPIKDGAPLGLMSWFSTLQDVSEQKRAEEERRESDRRFIEMMDKIRLISIMLDRRARITYCNDYLLELTGWQREEVIGGDWFGTFIPGDNTTLRETFEALLLDRPPTWHVENEILTRSGERRMVRWNNSVLRSAAGEVIGVASIGEDVTDRQRAEAEVHRLNADLERRVRARTAELEAANKELETYDYSISHDLRGPLNRIEGFSAALLEDHATRLDPAGQEHLRRIARAAQTLTQMVSDMLRLSTWSRMELDRGPVDFSSLALGILHALAAGEPGRKVRWAVEPGLACNADPGLMRVVLENLIGNAWKYSGKREAAVVEVGSITQDGVQAFWISDNGTGFDPLEARDLFKPFRRLASSAAFPGTGVGLATVLRIVRRHGGRIWAEGTPGEGATFYFTLEPEG